MGTEGFLDQGGDSIADLAGFGQGVCRECGGALIVELMRDTCKSCGKVRDLPTQLFELIPVPSGEAGEP